MRIQKRLRNTDGFVSTYFLSILLYIVSVITVIALRDKQNVQFMMNMKEANMYLQQEIRVINWMIILYMSILHQTIQKL